VAGFLQMYAYYYEHKSGLKFGSQASSSVPAAEGPVASCVRRPRGPRQALGARGLEQVWKGFGLANADESQSRSEMPYVLLLQIYVYMYYSCLLQGMPVHTRHTL
jgi:hypothetical protein